MEVCFYCADQNPHRDRSLGITNYTIGLLNSLSQTNSVKLSAIVSRSSAELPSGVDRRTLPFRTDGAFGRLVADHLHPVLIQNPANIWHYPKGFLPLAGQVKSKKVGTIADTILQYLADHYPESRSSAAFAYWLRMLKHSISHFDLILTVSEFSKRCIQEFSERYAIKTPEIVVTYEGCNVERLQPSSVRKEDYMVHLASTQPHKRTGWLLDTWTELQRRGVELPQMRLLGRVPTGVDLSRVRNVELVNAVGVAEYQKIISSALAVVLPSEIEGFGLPALEAYLLQTPVVYVNDTAVSEILGEKTPGGFTFDPESFQEAVNVVLTLSAEVVNRKALELDERFSWRGVADKTLGAYRSAN